MQRDLVLTELTDAELDAVAAGAKGLVAIEVQNVLNNNEILTDFLNDSTFLNNNQVGVGVAVAVLGAAAAGPLQKLVQ